MPKNCAGEGLRASGQPASVSSRAGFAVQAMVTAVRMFLSTAYQVVPNSLATCG